MSPWYEYFDVWIEQDVVARFKRHRLFRTLYIFQSNCAPVGKNIWNEPGYGYGAWRKL